MTNPRPMNLTDLRTAKRYGILLSDIIEDFAVYGYTFAKSQTIINKEVFPRPTSFVFMRSTDPEDKTLYQITIEHGDCPECGERCVSWGWGEGGYHSSTCKCGTIDFN